MKRNFFKSIIFLTILIVGALFVQANDVFAAAPTCTLTATPSSITSGGSSTLSWTVTNAGSAGISPTIGTVSPTNGARTISPTTTTTYTLTVVSPDGTRTRNCSATVTVSAPVTPAPTCTLTATPSSITSGGSSTLSWTATNATSAEIDNGIGSVAVTGGTTTVTPSADTAYTMTVAGTGGTATCSATVTVSETPPAPSCSFTIDPNTIQAGENSTLTWSSIGVSSVIIDNGIGLVNPNGSTVVSPNDATTYTGTFYREDGAGTLTCSISISVTTGGGGGGGGVGGSNPPTVSVASFTQDVEPSFIYLSQVPYTGLAETQVSPKNNTINTIKTTDITKQVFIFVR